MNSFTWHAIRFVIVSILAICVSGALFYYGISIVQTPGKFLLLQGLATFILIMPATDAIMSIFRKK